MYSNNNYPYGYQQYLMSAQQPLQNPTGSSLYFVNSQKEVEDWVLGAGQTAFFFERNAPIFYIKSVAQNGLSQPIEIYDYQQKTQTVEEPKSEPQIDMSMFVTKDEFNELKKQIDSLKPATKKSRSIADE